MEFLEGKGTQLYKERKLIVSVLIMFENGHGEKSGILLLHSDNIAASSVVTRKNVLSTRGNSTRQSSISTPSMDLD